MKIAVEKKGRRRRASFKERNKLLRLLQTSKIRLNYKILGIHARGKGESTKQFEDEWLDLNLTR